MPLSSPTLYKFKHIQIFFNQHFYLVVFISAFYLFLSGCSGAERFVKEEEEFREEEYFYEAIENPVRLLIDEGYSNHDFIIESPCFLFVDGTKSAKVNKGNKVFINSEGSNMSLQIKDKTYYGSLFEFIPSAGESSILYKGKIIKGGIKIFSSNNSLQIVNTIDIEEYLKGVLPREMPLGRGNEYFEALKAQAICARTYTLQRLQGSFRNFDLYVDVRDQVYGGNEVRSSISDKAVDETKDMILTFNGQPATVFYHSTCGGKTEDARNIFTNNSQTYLRGIVDGENSYCSVSPSYNWTEVYPGNVFIERLFNANLISNKNYSIKKIEVVNRFNSGRVNELKVELSDGNNSKIINLQGNSIRSTIRTADNRGILRSIWFDISFSNSEVVIKGKGNGHGVGMCQWGALYQSTIGVNYKDILFHYFPGVSITELNDKK